MANGRVWGLEPIPKPSSPGCAAEQKKLREQPCGADNLAVTQTAREFYHKSEARPAAPFLDEYFKREDLTPKRMAGMKERFGQGDGLAGVFHELK